MNDEQMIEYLRSRGRAVPPPTLTQAVMAAVESAPPRRSWFAAFIPAIAVVAVAGALLMLAVLIGQRPVGPTPVGSEQPTPSATEAPSASPTPSPAASQPSLVEPFAVAVQVPTCEHSTGAYRVTLPGGWWTNPEFEDDELGLIDACQFFAPAEFDITSGDRDEPMPEGAAISIGFLNGGCVGYINPFLSSRETTVGGYPATVSELAFGKEETNPAHAYEYVVKLVPGAECDKGGQYVYAVTSRDLTGDYEQNKAVLDQMMETIEVQPVAADPPPPISGELPASDASAPPRVAGIPGVAVYKIASLAVDYGLACESFEQDPEMGGSFGLDCRAEDAGVSTAISAGYWAIDYVDDLHVVIYEIEGGDVPDGLAGQLFSTVASSLLSHDAASWVMKYVDDAACTYGCSAQFGASRVTVVVGERGARQLSIGPGR